MGVLYIAIIMIMRVVQSCYTKQASSLIPSGITSYIDYITLSKIFSALFSVITLIISQNFSGFNLETLVISTLSGLSLALCSLFSLQSLKQGTVVLNSIFSTAGLIVPCVAGIFAFGEPMSAVQVISVAVLLVSAALLISSSKKIYGAFSFKTLFLLIGVFFANGLTMFFQKLFTYRIPDGNVSLFSFFTFFVPAVILIALSAFMKLRCINEETNKKPLPKKLIFFAAMLAFAVFVINQLATMATSFMSSAVLFTFINGGATIIAAIVGAVVFKEKLTLKSIGGIILGVCSIICIKVF